jgi:DNA gyrase subunit B
LRYGKVIIMADADVDGSHIRTLLLTFFYRYYEELVKAGNIYIAQPPLYQLKKGKDIRYVYTEEEKIREMAVMEQESKARSAASAAKKVIKTAKRVVTEEAAAEADNAVVGGIAIQRYKGLGEMNPGQLWDTTMDPEHRLMLQVTIEDAEAADELFDVLMGNEVEPRRRFIQTHAASVKNLDI